MPLLSSFNLFSCAANQQSTSHYHQAEHFSRKLMYYLYFASKRLFYLWKRLNDNKLFKFIIYYHSRKCALIRHMYPMLYSRRLSIPHRHRSSVYHANTITQSLIRHGPPRRIDCTAPLCVFLKDTTKHFPV